MLMSMVSQLKEELQNTQTQLAGQGLSTSRTQQNEASSKITECQREDGI